MAAEKNLTLLIVDDEPETLAGYAHFLNRETAAAPAARRSSRRVPEAPAVGAEGAATQGREKYNLLLAPSGEKAVEIFKAELAAGRQVAAGFFDVKLGAGMDGLQTIQAIKALDPLIHCVVVTAYHDRSVDEINALFGEAFRDQWDYLNKPFTEGEIVQKARQMVAAWNRRRELEALTAQIIRSERMAAVGQVARGIGHEFGNILLRIIGKTDLALMEQDIAKVHAHLQVSMRAAERATAIVRNLQSFSRTAATFKEEWITQPLEEAISLINHEMAKSSVTLEKRFKTIPAARIDVGGLGQVCLNLMINAIHAMPRGGAIVATVEPAPGPAGEPGVVARIADTGSGIPDEVLPKIFEFAFTTKGDRGSGLGLSVSREIVQSHGGLLGVKTKPGEGTEFSVWVPIAGPASTPRPS